MSSSLHWRPVVEDGRYLGDGLKFILRERFGGGMFGEWQHLDRSDLDFLQGVAAAAGNREIGEEAKKLIALIEKHGAIEVREVS